MSPPATPPRYLPAGLPAPVAEADGLSRPYWEGLRAGVLRVQQCVSCGTWQFGPEWLCHRCHGFDLAWREVAPRGRIYSWERVWHPAHEALKGHGPYLVVVAALEHAGDLRMVGNLLGDPMQSVQIGAPVEGVFEAHDDADVPFTLLQWRRV